MSMPNTIQVTCSACGTEQTATVWSTVSVSADPSLKDELLAGRLNTFECTSCGHRALLDAALLYHDMQNEFCVHYYPPESLNDEEFLDSYDENGVKKVTQLEWAGFPEYMRRTHVVFDMDELVRYVIFRERLRSKWRKADDKDMEK